MGGLQFGTMRCLILKYNLEDCKQHEVFQQAPYTSTRNAKGQTGVTTKHTLCSLCAIWRCRLLVATVSASMTASLPTPAPARYIAHGHPKPPAPTISTLLLFSFSCPVWEHAVFAVVLFWFLLSLSLFCLFFQLLQDAVDSSDSQVAYRCGMNLSC